MDNIPMGLNESDDSSVLDIKKTSLCEHRCQVTKFLQNLNFSIPSFCLIDSIAIA